VAKPQPSTPVIIQNNAEAVSKPRYFEFVQGASNKFWEISQAGNTMTTRWGRIGSSGQSKSKSFVDEQSAASAVAALIEDKTAEGYIERAN
jgi:predicted DNA-binding WGR domain protein